MAASERRAGAALALAVAACRGGGGQSALDPRGPQADRLFDLWNAMLVAGTVVFVLVMAALAAALLLRRHPETDHAEREPARVKAVSAAVVATALTLVALLVYSVVTSRSVAASPQGAVHVQVVAHQWWWEVNYRGNGPSGAVRTANELYVPLGRPVEISLEARDVIHSFWVPNLHGKVDAIPGRTNRLWLQADEPGVYRGQCAEFCGLQHAKMAFFVVAVPPEEFERWMERQSRGADDPVGPAALRGREVFLSNACSSCHAVRGTTAMAAVAPDLTHLASRRSIAAGTLANNRGNLAGWILDPQSVKPGARMPPTELDGESLHALLDYLESLR